MFDFLNILSLKDIKYASIGSVVIKFGTAFFTFLNGILLARFLGADGFGNYIIAYSTMLLLLVPATLGLPNLITRYISKYVVQNNLEAIKGLLIKTSLFVFLSNAIIYALVIVFYFVWWSKLNIDLVQTLTYSFLLIPILAFGSIRNSALRGYKLVLLSELPDSFIRTILLFFCIVFCVLIKYPMTPQFIMLMHVLIALLSFFVGFIFLEKNLLVKLKHIKPVFHTKEWFIESIPFSINSGIQIVRNKSLVFLIAFLGNIEAVALYEVAVRGASLVSFTMDALNNAIAPFVSSYYEQVKREKLNRILKKTSRMIFLFSLPIGLTFILGGETLLNFVFGTEYSLSYIPLVILTIGQLVSSMTGSVGLVLNMTGYQKIYSQNNMKMLVLMLIISIPLIYYFDVAGAAVSFSSVLILQNLMLLYYVRTNLNIKTTVF